MQIRMVTWNIFFGKELQLIVKTIQEHPDFKDIDIFALQEASIHNDVEDGETIAKALGPQYAYFQKEAQTRRGMIQANAIIWNKKRVQVTGIDVLALPTYKDVHIGRMEKMLKSFLPQEARMSLVMEGSIEKKSFRFYITHFDVIGFVHKKEQLHHILKHDKEQKEVYFRCIAGDLNTFSFIKRPQWISLKELAAAFGYTDITSDIIWTFQKKSICYRQKLDAIFIKEVKMSSYTSWSRNIAGSDHTPVFALIDLE